MYYILETGSAKYLMFCGNKLGFTSSKNEAILISKKDFIDLLASGKIDYIRKTCKLVK